MISVYGQKDKDCLRTCVASVLEKDYEEIPWVDPDLPTDDFWDEYRKVFNQFEFEYAILTQESLNNHSFKGYSIGVGKTEDGIDHAVVCFAGEIVHNPSPKSIMKSIDYYILLIPMFPWKYDSKYKSKNDYIMESQDAKSH